MTISNEFKKEVDKLRSTENKWTSASTILDYRNPKAHYNQPSLFGTRLPEIGDSIVIADEPESNFTDLYETEEEITGTSKDEAIEELDWLLESYTNGNLDYDCEATIKEIESYKRHYQQYGVDITVPSNKQELDRIKRAEDLLLDNLPNI